MSTLLSDNDEIGCDAVNGFGELKVKGLVGWLAGWLDGWLVCSAPPRRYAR